MVLKFLLALCILTIPITLVVLIYLAIGLVCVFAVMFFMEAGICDDDERYPALLFLWPVFITTAAKEKSLWAWRSKR